MAHHRLKLCLLTFVSLEKHFQREQRYGCRDIMKEANLECTDLNGY